MFTKIALLVVGIALLIEGMRAHNPINKASQLGIGGIFILASLFMLIMLPKDKEE